MEKPFVQVGLGDDTEILKVFNHRKKPLLGAINGFCMTGGLEMALACDLLYASENAVFADTHTKVGLMPTWGMSQRLPRLIGNGRAKEMSLSGRKIDAHYSQQPNFSYGHERLDRQRD